MYSNFKSEIRIKNEQYHALMKLLALLVSFTAKL